jgi:hypothetical protein
MPEGKKESLYETLFKISQGDVELFKEETRDFLNTIEQYTGASVKEQELVVADEVTNQTAETAVP